MQETGLWIPISDKTNFIPKTLDNAPLENNEWRVKIPETMNIESHIIVLSLLVAALVERAVINYMKMTNGQGCAEGGGPGT